MTGSQHCIKRIFDLLLSLLGLLILFIPLCFLGCLLKVYSKSAVFFTQKRIGQFGRLFTVVKFRTMYIGSEKDGSITTIKDSRVIPIGRILRKYKLDELPQLWNVLIGKMSFVGPRPDVPGYADKLEGDDRRILQLKPGITGPASIFFRSEEELLASVQNSKEYNNTILWPQKVKINLQYFDYWSFWKDLGYILITLIPSVDSFFKLMKEFDDITIIGTDLK